MKTGITVVTLIVAFVLIAALAGCTWSIDRPTEEQVAIARYLCESDPEGVEAILVEQDVSPTAAAVQAYVQARAGILPGIGSFDMLGPERELYCALRGTAIATL